MDYRLYHAINQFVADHSWLGQGLSAIENWAVPVIAVATFALWMLARPGSERKWKLASASALASAALALLVNQLIAACVKSRRAAALAPRERSEQPRLHRRRARPLPSRHLAAAGSGGS